MSPDEFKRAGIRMYGRRHWCRDLAINLGLDPSTVNRMSRREHDIPLIVEVAIRGLLERHKLMVAASRAEREQRARDRHRYTGKLLHRKHPPKRKEASHELVEQQPIPQPLDQGE